MAFINVGLRDRGGRLLAVPAIGLDVRSLLSQLLPVQKRYGARILLVDRGGKLALSSDRSFGLHRELAGLAPIAAGFCARPTPVRGSLNADVTAMSAAISFLRSVGPS